jgi:hypothetical protein
LPNIVELLSVVKAGSPPNIDATAFPNTPASLFWSASAYASSSSYAWVVGFYDGYAGDYYKGFNGQVRLVRVGQYFGAFGISGVSASAAILSATSAVAATGYWLVVPRNAAPPSAAQVIAGGASYAATTGAVSIAAAGSGAMTAKTPATFTMSGLAVGTAYDVYTVSKESTYQSASNVAGPLPFSTLAISTSSIVTDPSTPTKLYAALDGGGVYASTNSGTNWTSIANGGLTNLNLRALAIQNSSTLFAATYDGGAFRGRLAPGKGWTWEPCGAGLDAARLRSLTLDASGNLYAGSETGVFKGSTACGAWAAMNNGLPL